MGKKIKYYSSKRIRELDCKYSVIFGERSNGKTTDLLDVCLQAYIFEGHEFAYMRRWEDDIKGNRGSQLFAGINNRGLVTKYTGGQWTFVKYWNRRFYLARYDEKLDRDVTSPEPIGYTFAISAVEHDKGNSYPKIKNVVFDEFLSRTQYLTNEFVLFCNTISTIVRERDDVKIYMLGNTVNQYCPYFAEMGLNKVKQMKPGQIDVYEYGDSGLRVAVEYAEGNGKDGKPSDVYFAFDNPRLKMITGAKGEAAWELDIYPHCPTEILPKDIVFIYFILFDGELLQCEIIAQPSMTYTFIHRKTTELKDPDKDLIYSTNDDPRPNWRRRITRPMSPHDKKIIEYFQKDKVFYQDNEVGEIVRNYIEWCRTA